MLQRVSFAVLLALVTTSCSTSTIEDPAGSVVTSSAPTATQEDSALAEELLRTTSSVLQEVELVERTAGESEQLALALESLATGVQLLARTLEDSASQESREGSEVAAAIRDVVPGLESAIRELSYMMFVNAAANCSNARFTQNRVSTDIGCMWLMADDNYIEEFLNTTESLERKLNR
jgi:hypothetical protein